MKEQRYAAYQSLLKALAQATIARRPADWMHGTLVLERRGERVEGRLERDGVVLPGPLARSIQAQAQALTQAFAEQGTPWVQCRIGFFRKQVGWGVSVHITPTAGAPEVDLSGHGARPPAAKSTPAPAPAAAPAPGGAGDDAEPQDTQPMQYESPLPALEPAPLPPIGMGMLAPRALSEEPLRPCPHCKVVALRCVLRDEGIDTFRCQACGTTLTMHASDELFDPALSRTGAAGAWLPPAPPTAPAGVRKESDWSVVGPDFSVRISSPETLLYKAGAGTVPFHLRAQPGSDVRVVEASRVTTMDTPFGSRMLTPREHEVIVQNLQAALPLLDGRFALV